jgi:hypothetical protein
LAQISAWRIGGHVYRYLKERPRIGRVASGFRHGFNVLFEEESDPGFVSIQAEGVPLHPWAVASELAGRIRVGDLAVAEADRIRFREGDIVMDVSAAAVDELRIEPHASEEGERALSRLPILKMLLEEERAKRDSDPFRPEIGAILKRWRESGDSNALLDLVGLGTGSTPSGDDVLVGMLAGFTAFERISDEAKTSLLGLRATLHSVENRGTSLPSAQMLAAAANGSVLEPVLEVLSALASEPDRDVRPATRSLASQGATSGLEMLAGILQSLEDLGSRRSVRRRDGRGV